MRLPAHEFPDGFVDMVQPLLDGRHRFVESLSSAERWVCTAVVDAFVGGGSGPTRSTLIQAGVFSAPEVDAALAHLDARDMLVLQADRVLALYPFSDRPCPHRVRVGAKRHYGM